MLSTSPDQIKDSFLKNNSSSCFLAPEENIITSLYGHSVNSSHSVDENEFLNQGQSAAFLAKDKKSQSEIVLIVKDAVFETSEIHSQLYHLKRVCSKTEHIAVTALLLGEWSKNKSKSRLYCLEKHTDLKSKVASEEALELVLITSDGSGEYFEHIEDPDVKIGLNNTLSRAEFLKIAIRDGLEKVDLVVTKRLGKKENEAHLIPHLEGAGNSGSIEKPRKVRNQYSILSFDGGGSRGVIGARIVEEIEKITEKPITDLFDCVAGTSTGGIAALSLVTPKECGDGSLTPRYSAKELREFYETHPTDIFINRSLVDINGYWRWGMDSKVQAAINSYHRLSRIKGAVVGAIPGAVSYGLSWVHPWLGTGATFAGSYFKNRAGPHAGGPKYYNDGLEKTTDHFFGDTPASMALNDFMVSTYDVTRNKPVLVTRKNMMTALDMEVKLSDLAQMTAAAPTFFSPKEIKRENCSKKSVLFEGVDDDCKSLSFVDGGVFCNSPAQSAVMQNMRSAATDNMVVLSLGTGFVNSELEEGDTALYWAQNFLGMNFRGQELAAHANLQSSLEKDSYLRIQPELEEAIPLDAMLPSQINSLLDVANKAIEDNEESLRALCKKLTPSFW